ncbi:MAG TPA: FAD:protein FMN transferase [Streptosporangiaceae bacterium]|nr:FAD:protein FMN transferase [Streptosporangiaceae bacterium]
MNLFATDTTPRRSASPASTITLARPAVPAVAGSTMQALGTFCSVLVTEPSSLGAARQTLASQLTAIDLACSRFRPDSELSALNRSDGIRQPISQLFADALSAALRAAEITDGDVDPTCGGSLLRLGYDKDFAELEADRSALTKPPVPAPGWRCVDLDAAGLSVQVPPGVVLDLGATAKAFAADVAAGAIFDRIGCGVLVNLGGDIAIAGPPPDGGWRIGVDDRAADGRMTREQPCVAMESGGIATSCPAVRGWRRGSQHLHHIIVPGTGRPAEIYWTSVSVAAATCIDANTASTACIIRGRLALSWLHQLNLPARLTRHGGTVVTTGGWPG